MTPDTPDSLLPCPFCGSASKLLQFADEDGDPCAAVVCINCGGEGCKHVACMDDPRPNAAASWNRRAPQPVPDADMARAMQWVRDHACSEQEHVYADCIEEAVAAYDPAQVGARTGRAPQQAGGEVFDALYRDRYELATQLNTEPDDYAALQTELARLRAGIVPRGDDMIVPVALLDEINTAGAAWKDRAEAAERSAYRVRLALRNMGAILYRNAPMQDYRELYPDSPDPAATFAAIGGDELGFTSLPVNRNPEAAAGQAAPEGAVVLTEWQQLVAENETLRQQLAAMEDDRNAQCALLAAGVERELNWQLRAEAAEAEADRRTRELELTYQVQRDLTQRAEHAEAERDRAVKDACLLAASLDGAFGALEMDPHPGIAPMMQKYQAALTQGADHG